MNGTRPRFGKRLYVVIAEPTERANERGEATSAHLAWLRELEDANILVMAGPFVFEDGISDGAGMFILRASSLADAQTIAARDPYNARGYRTSKVRPWRLDQGMMAQSDKGL